MGHAVIEQKNKVITALLSEIELWREILAPSVALHNPCLSEQDLNNSVQLLIDRLLFLRICEDRGIEAYGQILSLASSPCIYRQLCDIFHLADTRYNSGLFRLRRHDGDQRGFTDIDVIHSPDSAPNSLVIEDEALRSVIKRLYFPISPFDFSDIPSDTLGQVYEQFLGKTVRLLADRSIAVEQKPEVRKAGGVFYTPTYIVEYMVRATLGKLLEGKSPDEVATIKLVDPACGAGSFLIGAYDYLLSWHLDWYTTNDPHNLNNALYKSEGEWRLKVTERKRILLNNIYGVDLDKQAIEVTGLSLLLKVLEGETRETLAQQFTLTQELPLPDLASNIRCGNALIGPDFNGTHQLTIFDQQEPQGSQGSQQYIDVNAFDWKAQFPQVFQEDGGGFNLVIGNPPYIRVRALRELYPADVIDYYMSHYECATHVWDLYLLFFERALDLLHEGGLLGFIVPVQTLHQPNCESLRKLLVSKTAIRTVADLSGIRVFQDALVKNCILICEKGHNENHRLEAVQPKSAQQLFTEPTHSWPQRAIKSNPHYSFKYTLLSPHRYLSEKLREQSWELDELCYVTFGLRSCGKSKGSGGKDRLITTDQNAPQAKPYMEGRDIGRYRTPPPNRYIQYLPHEMYSPRSPGLFEKRKIVSQSMLSRMRLIATLDTGGTYVEQSLLCIVPHDELTGKTPAANIPLEFILGVLNSRVQSFYFSSSIADYSLGGGMVHATPGAQSKLIVPRVDDHQSQELGSMVEHLLYLHTHLSAVASEADKRLVRETIEYEDAQIDRLVCEIYGLTDTEVDTVYKSATWGTKRATEVA